MNDHPEVEPSCHIRAFARGEGQVRLVTRNLSFDAERQLGMDPEATRPAALDLLVGALATDLLVGFGSEASRAGIAVHDAELRLEARLDNPLVALGVVGEPGSPVLASVRGVLHVSADADEEALSAFWARALERGPVFATLSRSTAIHITLRIVL